MNTMLISAIIWLAMLVVTILIIRLLGAWMLRINEVVRNQKTMIEELRELNRNR